MEIIGARIDEPTASEEVFEKIESYRDRTDSLVQVFDHSKVVGEEHLLWALQKAKESFENGSNRANSIEIETLLWSSGEWQIKDAIDKMGLKDGSGKVVILLDEDHQGFLDFMGWTRDDTILEANEERLKAFGIGENEIESVDFLEDLVFEKMATSIL